MRERERVHQCNVCDRAFQSLQTPNQHTIWEHSGHMFFCKGCGKKFKTNNSINRRKMVFGCKPHHRKRFCNSFMWDKGGGEEKDGSVQLQEEGRHPLPFQLKIYYLVFNLNKMCVISIFKLFFFNYHLNWKYIILFLI